MKATIANNHALNNRQLLAADHYIVHGNKDAAYLAAYGSQKNKNSLSVAAHKLLTLPKVVNYINYKKSLSLAKHHVTKDRVINEIAAIAFANMAKYYDANGEPIPLNDLSKEDAAAIKEVRSIVGSDGKTYNQLILHSKLEALDKLAKHLGLYELDNKQTRAINLGNLNSNELLQLAALKQKLISSPNDEAVQ